MHEGLIPPTIGTEHLERGTRFDLVMARARAHSYSTFQVNAFGFGGQNASLIVSL
jgi:3-oxoacyl-[acyl-carrier-protein] synthase II